jgi:predicted porin
MQKKLIALAVASLASGAAFAQTNVTMYGIATPAMSIAPAMPAKSSAPGFPVAPGAANIPGTNTFSGVQSGLLSGSRLGFRGEEALGNGLKAIFTLEYSLNIDDNSGVGNTTSGLQARQQFVGLSGGFGAITLGRQYAPGYRPRRTTTPPAAPLRAAVLPVGPGRQHHHAEQRRALEQLPCLHHPELGRLHRQADLLLRRNQQGASGGAVPAG